MALKHAFQSAIADGADATLVRPQSSWNADHLLDGNDKEVLFNDGGSVSSTNHVVYDYNAHILRLSSSTDVANGELLEVSVASGVQINSTKIGTGITNPISWQIDGLTSLFCDVDLSLGHNGAIRDLSFSKQIPSTGFSIAIPDKCSTVILDPAGSLVAGTLTMPATPGNGQILRVTSTQAVSTLTLSPHGAETIKNAPAAMVAGVGFGYIYVTANTTWYRLY